MAFQHRDQTGTLFKNDRKELQSHADWRGEGIVNGQPVWINAWIKSGSKGDFLSISFKNKQAQPKASNKSDDDSEVPF